MFAVRRLLRILLQLVAHLVAVALLLVEIHFHFDQNKMAFNLTTFGLRSD